MNLDKYFEDIGAEEAKIAGHIKQLVGICASVPINNVMVCSFDDEKIHELAPPRNVEKNFDELEELAKREAGRGNAIFILIRANGKLFLNVGAPYKEWALAYKVPGHDVFVLEKQD